MILNEFTKLKLEVLILPDATSYVYVLTPHKGMVEIRLTQEHTRFLFGGVTETKRKLKDIIDELNMLEEESKNYLLNIWINS